jgi:class 3 adenylate cyclase
VVTGLIVTRRWGTHTEVGNTRGSERTRYARNVERHPRSMDEKGRSEMEHPSRHRRWFEDLESFSRRVLTTVLFTDVVDSTGRVCELGDRRWTELLRTHHARFRDRLALFGGREVDAAGDGFLAAFDVPTRAVAFACAFHHGLVDLRLQVRTGVHTGECELEDGRLRGVAVHVGARLASLARPGEVLVSSTVRDVVAGSGLRFADRGLHELRGVPGQRRLYAARWNEGATFTRLERHRSRAAAGVTHRRQPVPLVDTVDVG